MANGIDLWKKCRIRVNEDKKFEYLVIEYYLRKFIGCGKRKMDYLRNNSGIRYVVHREAKDRRFYKIEDAYALHRAIWMWMINRKNNRKDKMPLMYYYKKELDRGGYTLFAKGGQFANSGNLETQNARYVREYRENNPIPAGKDTDNDTITDRQE